MPGRGTNGAGGARSTIRNTVSSRGAATVERAVGPQELRRACERPRDQAAVHRRADRVQAERERRDDADVRAGAAHGPEQVGVLIAARPADDAVGGDDLHRQEVVDGPAEAAAEVAEPAAEGEAADADLREEPEDRREAVLLRRPVHVAQQGAAADGRRPRVRVDGHLPQTRQVERHGPRRERRAGDVVAAAAHAQEQALAARDLDHRCDVVRGRGPHHERGSGLRHRVPERRRVVPAVVAGQEDVALQAVLQGGHVGGAERRPPAAVEARDADRGGAHRPSSARHARRAATNASGCSIGASSPASSTTCSGQP